MTPRRPGSSTGYADESASETGTARTQVVIRLRHQDVVEVRSHWGAAPSTIELEFPEGRVSASLPPRVAIRRGAIESMETVLDKRGDAQAPTIRKLSIQLRGRYDYALRQEPGRIIVDIMHLYKARLIDRFGDEAQLSKKVSTFGKS